MASIITTDRGVCTAGIIGSDSGVCVAGTLVLIEASVWPVL
jgi:hypothetical protein